MRGQALVEFALVLPVLLLAILGGVEMGYLLIEKAHQDRTTATIAEWAAEHPGESWESVANHELPRCDVNVERDSRGLVEATSRCLYQARVLVGMPFLDQIPISSRETAVERDSKGPVPAASPVASPS